MPAVSLAQERWLRTEDARRKLGAAGVREWLAATPKSGLPERVGQGPKRYERPSHEKAHAYFRRLFGG